MAKRYDPIMCMMVDEPTKAQDKSEKYAVTMKNSSGKEQYTQGWDLESIRDWIKDNEKRGYRVTWKNFDSKTIDKAHDSASALDKAIKTCDAVEVETSEWSFSSGKSKPSGLGNWWFKIGTEEKNFYGNWSNAKAEAIKYAKEKGINRISLMT